MIKDKKFDWIVLIIGGLAIFLTLVFINGEKFGLQSASRNPGYEDRLFDKTTVHEIDIQIDEKDWVNMLENARDEEYHRALSLIHI